MQVIPGSMTVLELWLYVVIFLLLLCVFLAAIKISSLEKQLRRGQPPPLQEEIPTAAGTTATPGQMDTHSNSAS